MGIYGRVLRLGSMILRGSLGFAGWAHCSGSALVKSACKCPDAATRILSAGLGNARPSLAAWVATGLPPLLLQAGEQGLSGDDAQPLRIPGEVASQNSYFAQNLVLHS